MNIYPAMRARMGSWNYFVVKMSMRELAENVSFGEDIHEDRTLDEAIQRILDKSRAKKDIVTYLIGQEDRFFSSIVVAALEGNPTWYSVTMEDDERFELFRDDPRLRETFGLLRFDGSQNYYALDGQHRLCAIKALVDTQSEYHFLAPAGFRDEEISVIMVVPTPQETRDGFFKRYRRLFSSLNRHAKPTDQFTNIVMDEDDAFAIITRRLITEHDFFRYSGPQRESARVKMRKGKNLASTDSYFTSLEALYAVNIKLLSSSERGNTGWDENGQKERPFKRFRPSEEFLDELFQELTTYWDCLIAEIPAIQEHPDQMRHHAATPDSETQDHLLFWPIGQELLAQVARQLMDRVNSNQAAVTQESIGEALRGLGDLVWDLHRPPWRNLLLVPRSPDSTTWRIRSEERKDALVVAMRIIQWQIGLEELAADEIDELRADWSQMLLPALESHVVDDMWDEVQSAVVR